MMRETGSTFRKNIGGNPVSAGLSDAGMKTGGRKESTTTRKSDGLDLHASACFPAPMSGGEDKSRSMHQALRL